MKLSFNLLQTCLLCCLVVVGLFACSMTPATADAVNQQTTWEWMGQHWTAIALIISEGASLLSAKWSGILKACWSVIGRLAILVKSRSK